jgi:uncharacterized membrane protein YccC
MMQGQQGGGQGAGSLMQQLQRLAGEQMSLNMQTQQMQSGGMSPQHASGAARLAQQQAALEKSLEQLNKESQQSSERQRLLGDLRAITDEMKEVVKNLEQNSTDPGIAQKQERILSRLLDASRSMNERDYEKKRKSESGKTVARQSPGALDSSVLEGKNRLQEYLLKALEQGYSKDEQELIKRYFQKLEQSEKP